MKLHLLLFTCILCLFNAKAQRNFTEAISMGDAAFKKGQFKLAIEKYFAAEAFDPGKKDMVNEKVKITFDRIETLRQEAIRLKKEADLHVKEAELQRSIADSARIQAQVQAELAREAKKTAENLAENVKQAYTHLQNLKENVIGARYKGGIVISWTDSTGKQGVIAADQDLGKFSWQEAKDTCENLILNGFDDWRLPTRTELAVLFAHKNVVGGFQENFYWSANEAGFLQINAWCQLFSSGFQTGKGKGKSFLVRPVRDFQK